MDEARLSEAVAAITRLGAHKLMEANRKATELLTHGLTVEGLPGWDGGRGQTIRYIDWETPANNRCTVINQYRVDCPPGFNHAKAFIVPDVVLLVNGLPLVVVECKSPAIPEPLADAVDQLRRYGNQRKAAHETEENEGNEALFATNQLLVATSYDKARVGCIAMDLGHYARWKTVCGPNGSGSEIEVVQALGKATLSEQERLTAGPLAPAHLLDVARNFMLFMSAGGQAIKSVCRYRWGSCGTGGVLYFHWKTILLPPTIAEYVVVHEMAHLHEPHHTPAFWRRVEDALPDYAQRKEWLAVNGAEVEGI